mmetsp:Transcript_56242/g.168396  ORF Transcript_56242/g.168396 Transcript_56242/m.168396 type:complete len:246 (-) Transcript_56242:583-1320(-)
MPPIPRDIVFDDAATPTPSPRRWPPDPSLRSEHRRRFVGVLRYLSESLPESSDRGGGGGGGGTSTFVREFDDRPRRARGTSSAAASSSSSSSSDFSGLGEDAKEALRSEYFAGMGVGDVDDGSGGGGAEVILSPADLRGSSCISSPGAGCAEELGKSSGCWIRLIRPVPVVCDPAAATAGEGGDIAGLPGPPSSTPLRNCISNSGPSDAGCVRSKCPHSLTLKLLERALSLKDLLGEDAGTRVEE